MHFTLELSYQKLMKINLKEVKIYERFNLCGNNK